MNAHVSFSAPLFDLGTIYQTEGAAAVLPPDRIPVVLSVHVSGDFGVSCEEDKQTNRLAISNGGRIMSAYPIDPDKPSAGYGENTIWIITERDRSVTTILLPSEY